MLPSPSGLLVLAALATGGALFLHACGDTAEPNGPDFATGAAGPSLTVTGSGTGSGTVSGQPGLDPPFNCVITNGASDPSTCVASYASGTVVTLTATPAAGDAFNGWTGACVGLGTCQVTLTQSRSVTARFKRGPFRLKVAGGGDGSGSVTTQAGLTPAISCTITSGRAASTGCAATYPALTVVTLTATPAAGTSFAGWSGGRCSGTGTCAVTMREATTVTAVFGQPPAVARQGSWGPLFATPVIALHLHLLRTGKVLLWGHGGEPQIWDPANPSPGTAYTEVADSTEMFCAGHTFLTDGRLLVAGGHISDGHGLPDANIFDPATSSWTSAPAMAYGRWYPTSVTLADGQVVTFAGTDQNGANVGTPERWNGSSWVPLTGASRTFPYYPRAFLAPDGRVFYAGESSPSRYLDPTGAGSWSTTTYARRVTSRSYGSAVMYAPGKILYVGGGDPPTSSAEVIDLNAAAPAWRSVAAMSVARRHNNATILADGKVLVTGGTSAPGFTDEAGSVKSAELWDPDPTKETWSLMASETAVRVYHSTALLLPDGRVLSTGSGDGTGVSQQYSAQIFSPPYLFNLDGTPATRPTIGSLSSTTLRYGRPFSLTTADPTVTRGKLIRLSSVTHAFNQSQMIYPLTFTPTANGGLTATAPPNGNVAPPGPYMLFLVNAAGVPSLAKMVTVRP